MIIIIKATSSTTYKLPLQCVVIWMLLLLLFASLLFIALVALLWVLTRSKQTKKRCLTTVGKIRQELIYCNIVFRFIDRITRMTWLRVCTTFVMGDVGSVRCRRRLSSPNGKRSIEFESVIWNRDKFHSLVRHNSSDKDHWHDVT